MSPPRVGRVPLEHGLQAAHVRRPCRRAGRRAPRRGRARCARRSPRARPTAGRPTSAASRRCRAAARAPTTPRPPCGRARPGCSRGTPARRAPPSTRPRWPASGTPLGDPAGDGDHRVPDVDEVPLRADPGEDVDPPPARGLRPAHEARLVEHLVQHGRDGDGVGEVGARLRVEVDAQLVGPVGVGAAHRPRVEVERAHVRRPQQDGGLGGAERVGRAAAGERDPRRLGVGRGALGQALGVERLAGRRRPGSA